MYKNQYMTEAAEQGMLFKKRKQEMTAAERVGMLQGKLYCKAKQESGYRFYVLYDKMFVKYLLQEGYNRVKANGGSPGIDGQNSKDIENYGQEKFLHELGEDLSR